MSSTRIPLLIAVVLILIAALLVAARVVRGQAAAAPAMAQRAEAVSLPGEPVAVPFRFAGNLPAVEVEVNGEGPFLFWLDTGAMGLARADRSLVEKLGLEARGEIRPRDGFGRSAPPMKVVRFDSLAFGGAEWKGVEAASRDYNRMLPPGFEHIDGILGFHLFADHLLTLDYPGERVVIEAGELPPADGREVLELDAGGRRPGITLEVAGEEVAADLDSGFQGTLQLPAAVAEPLLAGEPVVVGRGRTAGGELEIKEAPIAGTVRIGEHQLENPRVVIAEVGDRAVVGSGLLREFAVTFDQRNGRVRFARPEGAEPVGSAPRYRVGVAFAHRTGAEGLVVMEVFPGGAGEKAGLQPEDLVVTVDGQPALAVPPEELRRLFGSPEPVQLTVERGGETLEVELTPQP